MADTRRLSTDSKEEVDAAWKPEIARRSHQIDSGEVECVPWEVAMAELRASLMQIVVHTAARWFHQVGQFAELLTEFGA